MAGGKGGAQAPAALGPRCSAAPVPCRDATSLAHCYDVYARQLELSVVDNVLLVSVRLGLWGRRQRRRAAAAARLALGGAPEP